MKKIFDNIHSMVNDVLQVLDEFATAWQGNARAVGIINRLKGYLPDIEYVNTSMVLYSKPFTRRKQELKPEIIRMAKLIVSSFLVAFTDGIALEERHRIPLLIKNISRYRMAKLYESMVELAKITEVYNSELIRSGLPANMLEQFNSAIEETKQLLDMPREANTRRKNSSKGKEVAIHEVMLILRNELDPLIMLLGVDNPELERRYKIARRWLKPQGGRKRKEGDADSDSANQEPTSPIN